LDVNRKYIPAVLVLELRTRTICYYTYLCTVIMELPTLPTPYSLLPTVLCQKQPVTCTTDCPSASLNPCAAGLVFAHVPCTVLVDWRIVPYCLSVHGQTSTSSRSKLINVRARSVHSPFLPAPHLATLAHGILWSSMCVQLHTGQRESKSFEKQFTSPHFGPEKS
jgi:hypothetical protein